MPNYGDCPLMAGSLGRCIWCDGELTGRARKWCAGDCEQEWRRQHWWADARVAAIRRDQWTCIRCGHVGWWEPTNPLRLQAEDHDLDPMETSLEQWAVALGLLTPHDETWSFSPRYSATAAAATAQLPDSIRELVRNERPRFTWNTRRGSRYRAGGHELEVNHIEPRRGRGYNSGCHHHLDNLETLCRPCHQDETNRQRRGLPSWRHDPRPIPIIEGHGHQTRLL